MSNLSCIKEIPDNRMLYSNFVSVKMGKLLEDNIFLCVSRYKRFYCNQTREGSSMMVILYTHPTESNECRVHNA